MASTSTGVILLWYWTSRCGVITCSLCVCVRVCSRRLCGLVLCVCNEIYCQCIVFESLYLLSVRGRPLTGGDMVLPVKQGCSVAVEPESRPNTPDECSSLTASIKLVRKIRLNCQPQWHYENSKLKKCSARLKPDKGTYWILWRVFNHIVNQLIQK